MKKSKLFLIPLSTIVTTISVVPMFVSCSCDNNKEISEDYSLSVVSDKTSTDIYYNANIDKFLTDNKQYVTFKLKLNQPFYVEWQNEVVSQIVGLPWIVPDQTRIIYGTGQYADAIDIDKNEIQLYPSADHQTFTLFVPYTIKEDASYDIFAEDQTMFKVQFTANFYKGTGAQFENNEMTAISKSFTSPEFTVVHKKEKFVNADSERQINITQNEEPIQLNYELHKNGYKVSSSGETTDVVNFELPKNNDGYDIFYKLDGSQYTPKIAGNQLTFYVTPTDNVRKFQCVNKLGDLEEQITNFQIDYTGGRIVPRHWEFEQAWKLNYQLSTGFVDYVGSEESKTTNLYKESTESQFSESINFNFKLNNPLKEGQEIWIYGMTDEGNRYDPYFNQPILFCTDEYGSPIPFDGLQVEPDEQGNFTIPQCAGYYDEVSYPITRKIKYAIQCEEWSTDGKKIIWTQTFDGFQATAYNEVKP